MAGQTDKTQKFLTERFGAFKPAQIGADEEVDIDPAAPTYGSRATARELPKKTFPKNSLPPVMAAQMVRDMHMLDANPRLDLASFTTTYMEKEAEQLIAETLAINIVDTAMYPSCVEMDQRCCNMLADLWHCPVPTSEETKQQWLGTSTIGSSEACMLGGLALKRAWQVFRRAKGKDTAKPNLVLGHNAQVCWHKFLEYFEVEGRHVPVTVDMPVMTPETAKEYIDENTIGIIVMFGSTYNGQFEDVEATDKMITTLNKENDWAVRIHVDAASGGFVAPFIYPDIKWDFRLPNVVSINTSGHKYGLVYPGVGWVVWRNRACVDESLIFHINYLGVDQPSLQLNFSKGGGMVVAQYYQIIRLGFKGYQQIMQNLMQVATHLAEGILSTGIFKLIGGGVGMPVVAFALLPGRKDVHGDDIVYDEYDLADKLKEHFWQLPPYTLPPGATEQKMLRAVVREDLSYEMASDLVRDIKTCIAWLDTHYTSKGVTTHGTQTYEKMQLGHGAHGHLGKGKHRHHSKKHAAPC